MADSPVFTRVCELLEQATEFSGLEARGTVRLALKAAGLEARTVDADQMAVVLERVLPGELAQRGVSDSEGVCTAIAPEIRGLAAESQAGASPDAVFARLGG